MIRWSFVLCSVDINVRVTNSRIYKALFTLATTVAEFGDCCRIQRQIVAVSGDYSLQCGAVDITGLKDVFGGKR